MPAKSPPNGPKVKKNLRYLGEQIHARRKALKASATGTAEAASISRMTLYRIERGEPSVTMGAYLNVILVLGLDLLLKADLKGSSSSKLNFDSKIRLSDYPQLKKLAWQIKKSKELSPKEALNIYERNWRHINLEDMKPKERDFLQSLLNLFGKERLLV